MRRSSQSSGVLQFTIALTIGVVLASTAAWWFGRTDPAPVGPTTTLETQIGRPTGPADPEQVIESLISDRTVDHRLSGELTRTSAAGDVVAVSIRRARLGGRALDQVGSTVALTENEKTRQCEISATGSVSCAGPQPVATAEQEAAAIRDLFEPAEPQYEVFATAEPRCWLLVAQDLAKSLPFGRTSELCFDPSNRIVVSRDTNGREGSERSVVSAFDFDVDEADLEPG